MKLEDLQFLKEGGNAVKFADVTRIKQKDIPSTISYVSKISGIPRRNLIPVGSTGKTSTCGDIDLAVDEAKFNPSEIHTKMMKAVNNEGTMNKGIKVNSYAIPIRGKEGNGKVQVDLMFTHDTDYAQFAYFSAGEDSKYKGVIRKALLSAVASVMNEKGKDHFEYTKEGELLIRAGRTFDISRGLRRIFQHRRKKRNGDGYLKSMTSISMEEFKEMFPNVKVKGGEILVDSPEKIAKVLFGSNVLPKELNTAEQILHLIKKKFKEDKQKEIFNIAKKQISSLKNLRLPSELE